MRSTIELHPSLAPRPRSRRAIPADALSTWPLRLFERLAEWRERSRQRYRLQTLDDRLLRDIGLTRADVEVEATKRFWMR